MLEQSIGVFNGEVGCEVKWCVHMEGKLALLQGEIRTSVEGKRRARGYKEAAKGTGFILHRLRWKRGQPLVTADGGTAN